MSDPTLTERSYRRVDRASKLAGVALIAAGLAVGGDTLAGVALAVAGVAVGLATVFITEQ
ncbi:MAG: hypothetical protein V5A44_10260 [Haloarculaceae archaeon]